MARVRSAAALKTVGVKDGWPLSSGLKEAQGLTMAARAAEKEAYWTTWNAL
jgi:hypothetical protein